MSVNWDLLGEFKEQAKQYTVDKKLKLSTAKGRELLNQYVEKLRQEKALLGKQEVVINSPNVLKKLAIKNFLVPKIGQKDVVIKSSTKELSMEKAYQALDRGLEGWMLAHLADNIGDALGILVDGLGKSTEQRGKETQIYTSISKVEKFMLEVRKVESLEKANATMIARAASLIWGKSIRDYINTEEKFASYFSGFVFSKQELYAKIIDQIQKTNLSEPTNGGCIRWALMGKTMNPKEQANSEWLASDDLVNSMVNIIQEFLGTDVSDVDNIWEYAGEIYKQFKEMWLDVNKSPSKRPIRGYKKIN